MPARPAPLFVAVGQSCHKDNCRRRTTCCRGHIPFAAFYSYFMIIPLDKSISKCSPLRGIYASSMSISHPSSVCSDYFFEYLLNTLIAMRRWYSKYICILGKKRLSSLFSRCQNIIVDKADLNGSILINRFVVSPLHNENRWDSSF